MLLLLLLLSPMSPLPPLPTLLIVAAAAVATVTAAARADIAAAAVAAVTTVGAAATAAAVPATAASSSNGTQAQLAIPVKNGDGTVALSLKRPPGACSRCKRLKVCVCFRTPWSSLLFLTSFSRYLIANLVLLRCCGACGHSAADDRCGASSTMKIRYVCGVCRADMSV